jgi:hypothetical protein
MDDKFYCVILPIVVSIGCVLGQASNDATLKSSNVANSLNVLQGAAIGLLTSNWIKKTPEDNAESITPEIGKEDIKKVS